MEYYQRYKKLMRNYCSKSERVITQLYLYLCILKFSPSTTLLTKSNSFSKFLCEMEPDLSIANMMSAGIRQATLKIRNTLACLYHEK